MILWETAHSWHWAPDERWIVADRRWNGIGKLQSSHSFILVYCFCRRSIDAGNTIQSTLIYLSSIDWIRHSFYTCWAMQFAFWIEFNERLTNKTHIYESDSCSPHRNSNTSPQRHASPRFHVLFFFRLTRWSWTETETRVNRTRILFSTRESSERSGGEWKAKLCSAVSLHAHLNLISNDSLAYDYYYL